MKAVTDSNIYQALDLDWDDFEDSVQYMVGESFAADYIVTRNTKDYSSGSIPAVTPEEFLQADSVTEKLECAADDSMVSFFACIMKFPENIIFILWRIFKLE